MGTGGNNVSCVATVVTTTADVVGSLQARDYKGVGNQYVAENKLIVCFDEWNDGAISEQHNTLQAGGKHSTGALQGSIVRRLTPIECERLQGFPDDWTEGQADSSRYKQMGNAVCVNVVEWIVNRLVLSTSLSE
jgi:DNA (cytosine-5)-methyltransferase 1